MKKTATPRVIESADMDEIARTVRDHDLSSGTELGEWTGTIDGQPVTVRLVTRSAVVRARLQQTITAAFGRVKAEPKRTGPQASVGETVQRLRATANASRWF